jgi:hypothetical protein
MQLMRIVAAVRYTHPWIRSTDSAGVSMIHLIFGTLGSKGNGDLSRD